MPRTVTKPAIQIVGSTLKPYYWAGGVTKEGINTTIPTTMARIQGNIYKALTLPTEGIETHWEIFLALLHCIIFSQRISSYWLWHRRRCGRQHTDDHPKEADLPFLQPRRRHLGSIWMHPLRLTNLHFISLVPSVGTTFSYFDSKTQFHQLLYSDGIQPRFCSLGSTNPGSCGHRWRAYQTKSGNKATAPIGEESVQRQSGRWGR